MSHSASQPPIRGRVFVVGPPRSGTTLVQSLLAAHSQVTSFTESHVFSRHFRTLPSLGFLPPMAVSTSDPTARIHDFLQENGVTSPSHTEAVTFSRRGRFLPSSATALAKEFLQLLDRLAAERGADHWIEKTPRHLYAVPFLARLSEATCPTHFVYVVRDGLEVVASLHRASQAWSHPYDLATCVRRWNHDAALCLRFLRRFPKARHHAVVYEDLADATETHLARLLDRLELPWQPELLQRYGSQSRRWVTDEETWKSDVGRPIRPSATSEQQLSAEQRRRLRGALHGDLYGRLRHFAAS